MSITYRCAGCGKEGLTERTAVHVEGTNDYLCGKARKMDPQVGRGYDASANIMCMNNYSTQQAISQRKAVLFRIEPIQEMKATNNPQRV